MGTYGIDALILAGADEGDVFMATLVHHIRANCNRVQLVCCHSL